MKKKFVSLLLAAALVFSLGVPAFAEGTEALPAEPEAAVDEAEPEMAPEDETNEVVVTLGDTVTATTTEQAPAADTKTTAPAWPMSSTAPTALPLTAWTCAPISRATPQTAMSVR